MGGYKEYKVFDILQRNSGIIKYVFAIIVTVIVISTLLSIIIKENLNPSFYLSTENSRVDYKVFLKENKYFDEKYLDSGNQYIASLIDYIVGDYHYQLELTEDNIDYKYNYKVLAEINVRDKTNQKTLFKETDTLVEVKNKTHNSNEDLVISEKITIDYNKYNDLVQEFVNLYDLDNSVANVTVNMYVDMIEGIEESVNSSVTPAISLIVPLTTETMAIDIESNVILDNTTNMIKYNKENNRYVIALMVSVIILAILIIKFIVFMNDTKNEKNIYKMRLRRIMSNYGSYIQKINNEYEIGNRQILEMKYFEDLLQIKETMNLPILMTEKDALKETYFFIATEDTIYVFELRVGNLMKKRKERINPS